VGTKHRQLLLSAVVTASWLALSGGGSYAVTAQQETCTPSGNALSITAFDNKFDKSCLAAPADQAFTIEFSNLDRGIPHNVAIYEDDSAAKTYFKGELLDGPGKTTYSVEGVPAGRFFFRCDPHPSMNGTFVSG
jgi:plastocyanin